MLTFAYIQYKHWLNINNRKPMTNSKKYSYELEQIDKLWTTKIIRKVSSKKSVITTEKGGFESKSEAKTWAEQQLSKFTAKQDSNNKRHAEQRKSNAEERRLRSIRRSERKQLAKQTKADEEAANSIESD